MAAEEDGSFHNPQISTIFIGVGSAALVVSLYHCLTVGWCNRHRSSPNQQHGRPFMPEAIIDVNPTAQLIQAHIYKKGMGLVSDDDGLCAVCLCEFEEGEELRTLPECLHSYHAPCIDMWLHSHTDCPICRTDVIPSSQVSRPTVSSSEMLESGILR